MAVLSDADIFNEITEGGIAIPKDYESRIKTSSIDLSPTDVLRINGCKRLSDVFDGQLNVPLEAEHPALRSKKSQPYEGTLGPGSIYYSLADVPLHLRDGLKARVTTRSSLARLGLFVASPGIVNGRIPLVMKPYIEIDLPEEYPVSQIFLYEDGTKPLSRNEVLESIENGDIGMGNPVIYKDGSVAIHFHGPFLKHNRRSCIDPRLEPEECFDIAVVEKPLVCGVLYLAMTEEIQTSNGILGMIESPPYLNGKIHANAPAIKPGSRKQQALEIIFNEPYCIREGAEAGRIRFYRMRTPSANSYHNNGKYGNQTSPLSRSIRDFGK